MVAEEVSGGSDEVLLQFRAEKLDKKVSCGVATFKLWGTEAYRG